MPTLTPNMKLLLHRPIWTLPGILALLAALTLSADDSLRQSIPLYPGPGWQYADTGQRDTSAPPQSGWSDKPLQWPNLYWQKLSLPKPGISPEQRLILHIGACAYSITVYLNDQLLGQNDGPVTPYQIDLSDHLSSTGTDTLVLGLEDWSAFLSPELPPTRNDYNYNARSGTPNYIPDESLQGPIGYAPWIFNKRLWTNDIQLKIVPELRTTDVFVQPSLREAKLDITLTLRNDSARPRTLTLENTVLNWQESTVQKSFTPATLTLPPQSETTTTLTLPWHDPILWSPQNPHLYTVTTTLLEDGKKHDSLSTRFGFREFWIEQNAEGTRSWFVLNGHRQNLRGEGMWHPNLGPAYVGPYMDWLKENNFNILRLTNGGQPGYYAMADEKGLLIQSEIPFNFNHRYDFDSPRFWERAEKMLLDQIRAYRNHPSVVFWGVENEVILTSPGKAIGDHLLALEHAALALDPTRIIMHEGDGDLRTNIKNAPSPGKHVQVINIHDYEIELGRSGGALSIMDFPNASYAFGQAT